jgi:hypothetical protein
VPKIAPAASAFNSENGLDVLAINRQSGRPLIGEDLGGYFVAVLS